MMPHLLVSVHKRRAFPFLFLLLWIMLLTDAGFSQGSAPVAAPGGQKLTVILLGTGSGPPINLERYGPSTLVVAGEETLLFDCGRGATLRLAQAGVPLARVNKVFLTHLHSDHLVQLPDLLLTPWSSPRNPGGVRTTPPEVWGPAGTTQMLDGLQNAFAFDIHVRRDIDEHFSPEGIRVISHDIDEGIVYNRNGVTVTAFLVDHGPVKPAFGYRISYAGHSVALSGDTRPSENLVRYSRGVDVLVHEVLDPALWAAALKNERSRAAAEQVLAHHTSPEEAGKIFTRVKPRLAVFSHATPTAQLVAKTRSTYSGPLEVGEDLMRIEIGDLITVARAKHGCVRDHAPRARE